MSNIVSIYPLLNENGNFSYSNYFSSDFNLPYKQRVEQLIGYKVISYADGKYKGSDGIYITISYNKEVFFECSSKVLYKKIKKKIQLAKDVTVLLSLDKKTKQNKYFISFVFNNDLKNVNV